MPSAERLVANENLFRRVNERVEELAGADDPVEFVCECEDVGCSERILLGLAEYEHVRSASNRFVVRPGHEDPAIERVLDQGNGYLVVEKIGAAAETASEDDPRDP